MRKLVLLLVLAVLPLGAAAGPALVLMCGNGDGGEARSAMHSHQTLHDDHGHHNQVASNGGHSSHGFAGHGCCHFLYAAALNAESVSIGPAGPIYVAAASMHLSLFFPEQPKRPPLAILV